MCSIGFAVVPDLAMQIYDIYHNSMGQVNLTVIASPPSRTSVSNNVVMVSPDGIYRWPQLTVLGPPQTSNKYQVVVKHEYGNDRSLNHKIIRTFAIEFEIKLGPCPALFEAVGSLCTPCPKVTFFLPQHHYGLVGNCRLYT